MFLYPWGPGLLQRTKIDRRDEEDKDSHGIHSGMKVRPTKSLRVSVVYRGNELRED